MINLQNVTFSYAQTDGAGGIKNINLTVDSGEAVCCAVSQAVAKQRSRA